MAAACSSGPAAPAQLAGSGALGGDFGAGDLFGSGGRATGGTGASAAGHDQSAGGAANEAGAPGSGATSGTGGLPPGVGVGEDCTNGARCRAGLDCVDAVCTPSGATPAGKPCVIGAECASGLQCLAGSCAPGGTGQENDPCLRDDDCAAELRCQFVGLSAVCVPQGNTDVGGDCSVNVDCYQGLSCPSAACAPVPPGVQVFQGVECEAPSDTDVRAYFEVPGANDALAGDFFRLPFPNDVRRSAAGALDLSGFPTPGPGALGVDAVELYVDAITAHDHGWGAYPTVTFRFSGRVEIPSPADELAVYWVDVTPDAQPPWASSGAEWSNSWGRSQYVCATAVSVRRLPGDPLVPGHTYAVFLTTAIKDANGGVVTRPADLIALLDGARTPADPALAAAYPAYAPLRSYLASAAAPVTPAQILDATVFTVGPVRDTMAAVAGAVEALPPPAIEPGSWTKCGEEASKCPDVSGAGRDCAKDAADPDYDEYNALVDLPIFQEGTEPYLTPADGGGIADDLTNPRREPVCLSLTVPKGTAPASGWPLVVFAHGTGGSFRDHVRSGVSKLLSSGSVKFAVVGIDQVEHGPRRGDSTTDPNQLFFNFLNPAAARGNPIQGAADQLSLARLAATLDGSGEDPTAIDANELLFFGHSQGSTEGSLMLPYGDAYRAAVLSGNGASLIDALLTKTNPVDIKSLLPIAISDLGGADVFHPVLSLLQQWIDPADPLNFARYTAKEPLVGHAPKHVFQTFGAGDTFAPPATLATYAQAGGLTLVKPEVAGALPQGFALATADAPLSANEQGGTITLGVREYEAATNSDGHFVVFDVPEAQTDVARFLTESISGIPHIGQ